MVDALASGVSISNDVEVRVFSGAYLSKVDKNIDFYIENYYFLI